MAQSTLSVTRVELRKIIGHYMGYTRDSANWSSGSTEEADIAQALDEGTSRFYNERDWSFMSPATTVTTTIADGNDTLPDNFGSMRGDFYYAANKGYAPPRRVSPEEIYRMRTTSNYNGVMAFYAINPISMTGASGQTYEVLWYPLPDAAYVMTYRYNVLRDALSASYPYPAGGAAFRNALIEVCLAAAEMMLNRQDGHEQRYQMFLAQAIRYDGRNSARTVGYNSDGSDGSVNSTEPTFYCTYNGVVPD
jgi:hypothetical protein